ncbi:AAA family ATPase [Paenibacillus sp. GP183]|uniref:ATP-dependent nuclease n=1 Tax=Paenibacillus sp. GP183 TaxID=1882751 RepID=UPI0008994076|nr:AAA family ATPase [Paenibacillus sp. GP183]SEB67984.1 AAA domain-containing protein, putative AbiEii toxin, Type IV TA system [Paenibacillus sp. GP183]
MVSYLYFSESGRQPEQKNAFNFGLETREVEKKLDIGYLSQVNSITGTLGSALLNNLPTIIDIPAFRTIPSKNGLATEVEIHPDGRNLHNVIHTILSQRNNHLEPLQEFVRSLFPQYREIIAPNIVEADSSHYAEIQLRDVMENTIPLSACGAGVGQLILLASLVILRSEPTIFLMDEPHSFLHPEAELNLVLFLKKYDKHYYFVTTHSTTIINAADSNRVLLCTFENNETKIRTLTQTTGITEIFQEIGLRNADIALANKILFVEGEAEALVNLWL